MTMTSRAPVIETGQLTKRYGNITAVNAIDVCVGQGEVYGFLGANGAGKTTTLRTLLGLIRPTSGSACVLGSAPGSAKSLVSVGSLIETPAFYPHLSGRHNLFVLAKYVGIPLERIDGVLAQVDLVGRAGDPFRTYSLGMKQRLGVASALLKDPSLLILDEPTNGLDPAGMADMRMLIRRLGKEGRTVLVSSHLMTEIEQICDRVGVIAGGRLVAEGTVDELRGDDTLRIRADPLDEARRVVARIVGERCVTVDGDALRVTIRDDGEHDPAYLNACLVASGIAVRELRWERSSLESVFLELTADAARRQASQPAGEATNGLYEQPREVTHV